MNLLSLVPYPFLPPTKGGDLGIVEVHHHLGKFLNNYIVSPPNKPDSNIYNFTLLPLFPESKIRYIPFLSFNKMSALVKELHIHAIFCDHPYMAVLAYFIAKKHKIPWYLRSHNIENQRFKSLGKSWWRLLFCYERCAFNKAQKIFLVSSEDAKWANCYFKIQESKLVWIPFGTRLNQNDVKPFQASLKHDFCNTYNLDSKIPITYFIGAFDYHANLEAAKIILEKIIPILKQRNMVIQILLIGKHLPENFKQRIAQANYPIYYLNFLESLDSLFNAAQLMINPMLRGGGVKTKLVEALAHNKTAISTTSGAAGIPIELCNNKLKISDDSNWEDFVNKIDESLHEENRTIDSNFYKIFNWNHIAEKIYQNIKD
ncbi:MAG: glycosyltransferase [Alphaproteobacteria bacterium]|nr:glycosyltransferase [Alphaproteobacteria bacterium]